MRAPAFYQDRPVYSLQTMLRHISQVDTRILPVIPDSQYGSNTYAAVRSFQQTYGLIPTGEADLETWDKIVEIHNDTLPLIRPVTIDPIWSAQRQVSPEEFNYNLFLVQAQLAALSDFFPQLQAPAVTGVLDPITSQDLLWLQTFAGLQHTGTLNTATWNYLNGLFRTVIGDGTTKGTANRP